MEVSKSQSGKSLSTSTPVTTNTMFAALRASTSRAGARAFSSTAVAGVKMPLRPHGRCCCLVSPPAPFLSSFHSRVYPDPPPTQME